MTKNYRFSLGLAKELTTDQAIALISNLTQEEIHSIHSKNLTLTFYTANPSANLELINRAFDFNDIRWLNISEE